MGDLIYRGIIFLLVIYSLVTLIGNPIYRFYRSRWPRKDGKPSYDYWGKEIFYK